MKKIIAAILASSSLLMMGCSQDQETDQAQADNAKVVVYSARAEHLIKPLFDEFTKQTGIEVQFQTGKANALVERLKAESSNTPADILMTTDVGNLWYAADQGLFQPMNSEIIERNIPVHLRDPEQLWTGLSVRARTLVYHQDRVSADQVVSYEDLADPKWQGRLCLRTSNSVYNKSLVASLIEHHGEEKTTQIITGWVNNLAAKPQSKDSHVMDAILAGQCDIGLVNTYYYGRLQAENPDTPLRLGWANQTTTGTHINVSGAGLLKHANNTENALKLIEWLSEKPAQQIFGALNREYPANPNVTVDPQVESWGVFKQDEINLKRLGELQQAATMLINRVNYE
ncbi:extracellular solute-binding protein [Thiomicrospira pelophila]|uniref:extracellular solute-binding protein n=1 Tax=Thiomicrospira pelophila TaxID=934 RepID=UPI0004A6EFA7|nr:extracellular solute-binding protein [Thiomicrospira pelophila]